MICLATSPEPHTVNNARSVLAMFKAENMTVTTPRSTPPLEPDPEPNPEPDAALSAQQSGITPTDWDVLFHAVAARLQACTTLAAPEQLPNHAHDNVLGISTSLQATVLDCVDSMNLLHAALPRDWQQRHWP